MLNRKGLEECLEPLSFKKGLNMYRALKNFAWCIDFNKVEFEKDEKFGMEKVKHREIVEEMIEHKYAEEISEAGEGNGEKVAVLQDMNKVELANFAEKEFGVKLSGNKSEIIAQIEKLAEERAKEEAGEGEGESETETGEI